MAQPLLSQSYRNNLKEVGKGVGVMFGGTMASKVLLFFYTLFLARVLDPSGLGIYYLGLTIVKTLAIVVTMGFGAGIVRHIAIYHAEGDLSKMKGTVFFALRIIFFSSLALVLFFQLTGYAIAASLFHKPELAKPLKMMTLSIPFEVAMGLFLAALRGVKQMKYVVLVEYISWTLLQFSMAFIVVVFMGGGLYGITVSYVISSCLVALLAFYCANKHLPLLNRKIKGTHEALRLIKFSIPMVFTSLLGQLMTSIDMFVLARFVSASDLGCYSVAVRLLNMAKVIFNNFQLVFQPYVAELHAKKDVERVAWLLKTLTHWSVLLSMPVFLSLILFPELFIRLFNKELIDGAASLSILAGAYLISTVSNMPSVVIFMSGRSDITLKNNLVILIISMGLNYILISRYGMTGAAVASGLALVLLSLIRIREVSKLMGIHPFAPSLGKPIAAGGGAMLLVMGLEKFLAMESELHAVTALGIFWGLYLFFIWLFRFSEEDRFVTQLIQKKVLSILSLGGAVR